MTITIDGESEELGKDLSQAIERAAKDQDITVLQYAVNVLTADQDALLEQYPSPELALLQQEARAATAAAEVAVTAAKRKPVVKPAPVEPVKPPVVLP